MIKGTIFDTLPGKGGMVITGLSFVTFVYVLYWVDPSADDEFWLDMKLYSFWGANIGMALTFWSSVYVLIIKILEGLEKQQKRQNPKNKDRSD